MQKIMYLYALSTLIICSPLLGAGASARVASTNQQRIILQSGTGSRGAWTTFARPNSLGVESVTYFQDQKYYTGSFKLHRLLDSFDYPLDKAATLYQELGSLYVAQETQKKVTGATRAIAPSRSSASGGASSPTAMPSSTSYAASSSSSGDNAHSNESKQEHLMALYERAKKTATISDIAWLPFYFEEFGIYF